MLKSKSLIELIEIAKNIDFKIPNLHVDEFTYEQIFYSATFISLREEILIKAGLIICNMFPPLKIFIKKIIRDYIEKFS